MEILPNVQVAIMLLLKIICWSRGTRNDIRYFWHPYCFSRRNTLFRMINDLHEKKTYKYC